ncbi:MAG: AmmeMemoRadiSam system protein B [Alphaproteobacteria bacterium]
MASIRPPAVAGLFYPGEAEELDAAVRECLAAAETADTAPKALIAPHAGYVYSGPVAASAYARLAAHRDVIERVVLLGPAHRISFRGLAASGASAFATPFGEVPVDAEAIERALALPQVRVLDAAHEMEHSLEVHLPFLQRVLDGFALAPFVVGDAAPEDVAEVIELLWGGPETLVVVSSDLSHFLDYDSARRIDGETARAIEALQPDDIAPDQACGRLPIQGLLRVARARGLEVSRVDLRNSGDTAGPRDEVVGYGAWVFA